MPTLKQEISDRGIQGGIPNPNDTVEIPVVDPEDVNMAVMLFGSIAGAHPQLTELVNRMGPFMFAALLFTLCEEYDHDPTDPDNLIPQRSAVEAEEAAIGLIRAVASAMGGFYGDTTRDPSEAEIDADTEITPVQG